MLLAWFGPDIPPPEGRASRVTTANLRVNLVPSPEGDLPGESPAEIFQSTEMPGLSESVAAPPAVVPDVPPVSRSGISKEIVSAAPQGQQKPEELPSPEAIGAYRLNLARASRMFRDYPALARERNWEGVAVVVVTTVAGVGRPQVTLSQSSGFELLDARALSMVDQAVGIAALPDDLRGRQFALTLPIHFSLAAPND